MYYYINIDFLQLFVFINISILIVCIVSWCIFANTNAFFLLSRLVERNYVFIVCSLLNPQSSSSTLCIKS